MTHRVPAASGPEFIKATIGARIGGVVIDPTADAVRMCMLTDLAVQPISTDWQAASWETDSAATQPIYIARLLVADLVVGVYRLWVEINHAPEIIVRPSGLVEVYAD